MVSLKEIAAAAGVSIATVSKSLNGHTDISVATRDKINKIASEMGYLPNAAARTLKTNRTYNLGVLFVDKTGSGLTHEYFSLILDSFKRRAESSGYDITFISKNIGNRSMSFLEHCRYRNCDGVVVASVDFTDPDVLELVNSDIPVVTIDEEFSNCSSIISDNVDGIRQLVGQILSAGYRKIAYIHGEDTAVTRARLAGFYAICKEHGIDIPPEYVVPSHYHDAELCRIKTVGLLALPNRPTCILFPDDLAYTGGLKAITAAGLSVPDDIAAAGFDGVPLAGIMSPSLETFKQDTEALGSLAATELIRSIEQHGSVPVHIKVPGTFQPGDTVRHR